MSEERLQQIRSLHSIMPLAEHTDLVDVRTRDDGTPQVVITDKLPAPTDEFGIPRPDIMVEQLLGQMATKNFVWSGVFDLHHVATPKADYTVARSRNDGDIGSAFRGMSCLKIELPRQMHNFSHAIFELPRRPSTDVMMQALIEVGQLKQLHRTIGEYFGEQRPSDVETAQQLCLRALHAELERMKEPEVGMMPSLNDIADMNFDDVQKLTSSALLVRRFSRRHLIHPAIRRTTVSKRIAA